MSTHLQPITLPEPPLKRNTKRIPLACTNCRKRKIRCETNDDIPPQPCRRCIKHNLICQYLPVSEDPDAQGQAQMAQTPFPGTDQPYSSSGWPQPNNMHNPPGHYPPTRDPRRDYNQTQYNQTYGYTQGMSPAPNNQPTSQQSSQGLGYHYVPSGFGNQQPNSWPLNNVQGQVPQYHMPQGQRVYPVPTERQPCVCFRTPCVCYSGNYQYRR